MGWGPGFNTPTKIRIIPAEGGSPIEPVAWPGWQGAPTWTPDGKGLIFGENAGFYPIQPSCALHYFDLGSARTFSLPGTTGLWTARQSPKGRYIAAETRDQQTLMLYDMRTRRAFKLLSFSDSRLGDNPAWSKDGKCIYIDAPLSPDPAIYGIRIPERAIERVASLKGIQRANQAMGEWIGIAPDGSPFLVRQVQASEIYAWDWAEP